MSDKTNGHEPPASVRAREEAAARELALVERFAAEPRARSECIGQPVPASKLVLERADRIHPEPVQWIWEGYLPIGKLVIVAGAPGTGKTTLALSIAAALTAGGLWPDESRAEVGDVVIWSGEDDANDTLVPRLAAAGADMARIHIVRHVIEPIDANHAQAVPFDPSRDVPLLAAAIAEAQWDVRLIIVDSIVSAVAGDSHKNAETRRGLQPLVDLGRACRAVVVGITHFSKGTAGRAPLERVTGSLAFGALARVVFGTCKAPAENEDAPAAAEREFLFLRVKSNLSLDGGGFRYRLLQQPVPGTSFTASVTTWGEPVEGAARDVMAAAEMIATPEEGAVTGARAFLREQLKMGSKPVTELQADAKGAGISWRSIERAKAMGGFDARKNGITRKWEWYHKAANDGLVRSEEDQGLAGQDRQDRQDSEFGDSGGLAPADNQGRQVSRTDGVGGLGGLDDVEPDQQGEVLL